MIRAKPFAAVLATVLLAGCQLFPQGPFIGPAPAPRPTGTAMDGTWASTDGIFVATFQGGSFTSRFTQTNEILAQGSYSVTGQNISMNWLSAATQEQRSASCRFAGSNRVSCQQAGGGAFDLTRSA